MSNKMEWCFVEEEQEECPQKLQLNNNDDKSEETLNPNQNKELLIKKIIGLCVDKYCEKQIKCFDFEDNIHMN